MNEGLTAPSAIAPIDIPGLRPIRLLGEGGMARVYLAEQDQPRRRVVIKIVSPESVPARFMEVLKAEGDTAAQFEHDHLITIHACGIIDDHYYQVMPYLAGGDLADRIGEGLMPGEAVSIIRAIASALDHIHQRGFIHRDIKPGNILFTESGKPVLADFGIAKAVNTVGVLTEAGYSTGTPAYMSPEQVLGNPLDARSDLYSLGVVFYEALTGSPPFEADSDHQLKQAHVSAPVPKLPRTLSPVQPILNRLLAKHPEDRYPEAGALIKELDALPSLADAPTPTPSQANRSTPGSPGYASVTTWMREMSRRRVFRVMAIYIAVAWGFTEITTTISETLAWPGWTRTAIVVLFILGFPVAMLLSWLFDVGPAGVYRATPSSHKGMLAIFGLGAALMAATAGVVVWLDQGDKVTAVVPPSDTAEPELPVLPTLGPRSVAVLPFDITSAAAEETDYFADGLLSEIINQLHKIGDLETIGRSSSLHYRGTDKLPSVIGGELGVAAILAGNLVKAADRIRLDVELLDTQTGRVLWANGYDQPLGAERLLELQTDIAFSIAGALQATLTPAEEQRLAERPTRNDEAYNQYLLGESYVQRSRLGEAIAAYRSAVTLDPDFAVAWAALTAVQSEAHWIPLAITDGTRRLALQSLARAKELAPEAPETLLAEGVVSFRLFGDFETATERLQQALEQLPSAVEPLMNLTVTYLLRLRLDVAERFAQRVRELDPMNPRAINVLGFMYASSWRFSEARAYYDRCLALTPDNPFAVRQGWDVYVWGLGDTAGAAELIRRAPPTVKVLDKQAWQAYIDHDVPTLRKLTEEMAEGVEQDQWRARADRLEGNLDAQKLHGRRMATFAEADLRAAIDDERPSVFVEWERSTLAVALALAGDSTAAFQTIELALHNVAAQPDLLDAGFVYYNAVRVYTFLGEIDAAFEHLKALWDQQKPRNLTPRRLRLDPDFESLAGDPGVEALLAEMEKQPLR